MIQNVVYMIGHSKHPWPRFIELLEQHKIEILIDVRSSPQSRFSPQFNMKRMDVELDAKHINYVHAPKLGGKNPLPIDQLRDPLKSVLANIAVRRCLMCSEGDYRECHRHYLLAPLVLELGYQIQQIQPNGSLVLDEGPTPATLKKMAKFMPQSPEAAEFQRLVPSARNVKYHPGESVKR